MSNAGILRDGTFHKMTFENWDAVLKVHLYGGYNVIRAAWPHFREQSFGRVVVATSTSGLFGNFGQANYGAAKLGLVGLINTLAQEGAKYNIKANAVAPIAATRMTQDILPPEVFEKLTPEYVAPVVAYLCTEEMPDTDSVFIVGGGKVQRTALFQNEGVTFTELPSVDDIAGKWGEITDLSAAQPASFKLGYSRESACRTRAVRDHRDWSTPTSTTSRVTADRSIIDVGAAGVCFPDLLLMQGRVPAASWTRRSSRAWRSPVSCGRRRQTRVSLSGSGFRRCRCSAAGPSRWRCRRPA